MKKLILSRSISILILILTIITTFIFASPSKAAFAAELSDAAVIVLSPTVTENEITVEAVLRQNTALTGLTVEVDYDSNAMTLKNVERGTALSSLEYMTTNPDKGYDVMPFKINWSGEKNDPSTGTILKLYFAIKEGAADGEYTIALKTSGNKSATYIEGNEIGTKNVLIDSAKIRIENNVPTAVISDESGKENEKKPNIALIVSLSVVCPVVFAGAVVTVIVLKKKGKKSWKRLN